MNQRQSGFYRVATRLIRAVALNAMLGLFLGSPTVYAQAVSPGVPSSAPVAPASPAATPAPTSAARSIAAVIPFASSGASPAEVSGATDRLQEELYRLGKFALADRGVVDAAYAKQHADPGGCASLDCAIGVGFSLGADQVITGKLTKVDDTHWLIAAQLVDAQSSKPLRASTVQYEGSYFDLSRQAIPFVAARLSGVRPQDSRAISAHLTETFTLGQEGPAAQVLPPPASAQAAAPEPAAAESVAGPKRGFALFTGYSDHSGTFKPKSGPSQDFSAGGIPDLGLEYQWVLSSPITLSVYIDLGGGSLSGPLASYYDSVSASEIGLELRYWMTGHSFVGGRISSYGIGFFDNQNRGNTTLELDGTGYGISTGYEWDKGWFVKGALDYAEVSSSSSVQARASSQSTPVTLSGTGDALSLWVDVGYRWK
jgi:Protein of unknown function (DUF2380)